MLPEPGSYDRKIFRLLFILNKLDSEKKVSTNSLAKEFKVSARTVQRDLELLNMTGFPLVSDEKGYNSFAEDFSLKKLMLSGEEASMLSFLFEIVQSLGKNFENSFKEILRKVLASNTEPAFYVKMPKGVKMNGELSCIKALENAIATCRKAKIRYTSHKEEKEAVIHPLKIIFFDGFWYVLTEIQGKCGVRKFRTEHIKEVKLLQENFKVIPNLRTMLDESVNVWFSSARDKKVTLRIDKDIAEFFKQKAFFPLQKITKENKDGSLIIESKVGQYMEVIPTIKAWMPAIKVIYPKELDTTIKNIAKEYLKTSIK